MKLMPLQAGEIGSVAHVAFSAKASGKTVCTQPKLEISAEGPGEVLIGDDVIINIQVTNVGTGNAEMKRVPLGTSSNCDDPKAHAARGPGQSTR